MNVKITSKCICLCTTGRLVAYLSYKEPEKDFEVIFAFFAQCRWIKILCPSLLCFQRCCVETSVTTAYLLSMSSGRQFRFCVMIVFPAVCITTDHVVGFKLIVVNYSCGNLPVTLRAKSLSVGMCFCCVRNKTLAQITLCSLQFSVVSLGIWSDCSTFIYTC